MASTNTNARILNDIYDAACHPQCFSPEAGRGMHQLYDGIYSVHEFIELRLINCQRGRDLQHHKIIAAYLTEDRLVPEQPHHQDLSEHRGMYPRKCLEQDSEAKFLGRLELDRGHHPESPDFLDHLVLRQARDQMLAKLLPQVCSSRAQISVFEHVQSGQPGSHREAILAVSRGVNDGTLERGINRIVNRV